MSKSRPYGHADDNSGKAADRVWSQVEKSVSRQSGKFTVDISDDRASLHTHTGSGRNAGSQRGVTDGVDHHPSLGGGRKK